MTDTVAVLSIPIEADPKAFEAALARVEAQLARAGGGSAPAIGEPFQKAVPAIQSAERATLSFAQARARLLRDMGDLSGAERILQGALQQTTASTTATIAAQRQLLAVRKELTAGGGGKGGFLSGVGDELKGVIGFAGPATLAVGGLTAALTTAGAAMLETAERAKVIKQTLGELDPADLEAVDRAAVLLSTRFGADLTKQMAAARVVMQAFGVDGAGAMDIITAGFAGGLNSADDLTDTLQEYGTFFAALGLSADDTLNIIQRGLANGARNTDYIGDAVKELGIRLGEAGTAGKLAPLSAELAGLVEQFQAGAIGGPEAFQAIVSGIAAIEDPVAQQAAGVALFGTKFEDLGIQAITAMGQVDEALIRTAGAADQAGQRITSLGEIFPRLFAGLGQALQPVNDGLIGIANNVLQFVTAGDQAAAMAAQIAGSAGSYAEYRAQLAGVNQELQAIGQTQEPLTEAQFTYMQALQAGGTALEEAARQAAAYGEETQILADGTSVVVEHSTALADAQALLATNQAAAADATREAALAADEQANAAANAAAALDLTSLAAQAQEQAIRSAAQAAFEQANAGASLEAQARAAAEALVAAGAAGAGAAARLAQSSNQVDQLTAAYYRLITAQRAAGAGGGALAGLGETIKGAGEVTRTMRALNRTFSAGPLAPPRSSGGGGSKGGGGGGGGDGTSAAEKGAKEEERAAQQRADRLLGIQERYQDASVSAERAYQEQLTAIAADFAARRAEAEEDFADDQVASRAGFYRALRGIDDQQQRQALAAEFEREQIKASEIAATQGADVAAKYLAAITQILQDRAKRQAEIAQALKDGNKGDAEYLQGLDQLDRQVEDRQIADILAGQGSLADQEAQRTADAETKRQQALTDAATTAGAAMADLEKKKADAATATNLALQTQLQLLEQIGSRGGVPGAAPAPAAPAPAPAAAAPTTIAPAGGGDPAGLAPRLDAIRTALERGLRDVERAIGDLDARAPFTTSG